MKTMHAFSLLELLICLFISSVILNAAVPALRETAQNNQETQSVNQLIGILQFARSSAVFGRNTVGVCAGLSSCSATLSWRDRVLVFIDTNQNGQLDQSEDLLRSESLSNELVWQWSNFRGRNFLQFEQDGTTRALNGTLTLCKVRQPRKQIVISLAGRPRVQVPQANATCN